MQVGVEGRVILVTGAAQGIGRAIAEAAAQAGADGVVIVDRSPAGAEAAAALPGGAFVKADLAEPDGAERAFDEALSAFGRIDGLVNAAGLTTRGGMEDGTRAILASLIAVNLEAPFILMQRLIRHLKARGAPGEVVNILSMNIHGGAKPLALYSASKAALAVLTKNAAQHHRYDRIRVNGVNLGWADTPAERVMQAETLGHGEGWLKRASAEMPWGRLLVPEDVARLTLFLMSPASEPMTGALVDQEQWVAGGWRD